MCYDGIKGRSSMLVTRAVAAVVVAVALGSGAVSGSDGAWDPGATLGGYRTQPGGDFFPHDHIHDSGCGHAYYDGGWRLFPREHVHGAGCGHYYVGGRWDVFPSAHRHSFACGHYFYNGMWNLFPPAHVHGDGCGHFYWSGCWHLFPEGHVHGAGCGHMFQDGEWRAGESSAAASVPPQLVAPTPQPAVDVEPEREPVYVEPRVPPAPVRRLAAANERQSRTIYPLSDAEVAAMSGPRGPVVVIQAGPSYTSTFTFRGGIHVHGFGCGHYYHRGGWYERPVRYSSYHVHGVGCGHYYWNGGYRTAPCPPNYYDRFRRRRASW
jgi:hypothetical protein